MPKSTVRAVRHPDGHLELLEPIDLPLGAVVPITVELPDPPTDKHKPELPPVRNLGRMKGPLTREEIYDDVV